MYSFHKDDEDYCMKYLQETTTNKPTEDNSINNSNSNEDDVNIINEILKDIDLPVIREYKEMLLNNNENENDSIIMTKRNELENELNEYMKIEMYSIINNNVIYSENISNDINNNDNIDESKKETLKIIEKYCKDNNNRLNLSLISELHRIYNESKNELNSIMYIIYLSFIYLFILYIIIARNVKMI